MEGRRSARVAVEGPAPRGVAGGSYVRWTHGELDERGAVVAEALRARGVTHASRVAAVLPPGPEALLLLRATSLLDATLVPLNAGWPEPEIARALDAVAPVASVLREGEVWTLGLGASRAASPRRGLAAMAGAGAAGSAPAAILMTSGSSGVPRPIALSRENLEASARGAIERLGLSAGDRWLAVLSPAHVGGLALLHRAATVGCAVVTRPRFDADEVAALLDAGEFTHASLVPVLLARLVEARLRSRGDAPLPNSLRCLLVGGAGTPRPLLDRALSLGYPIALTYGLTEATSQVATAPPEEVRRSPGGVGRPLVGVEVRIAMGRGGASRGAGRAESGEGEILVRGSTVALGAPRLPLPDPGVPTVGVDAEGWLHTGDLGRIEADGVLRVTGRLSDRIVSGGVTVEPAEVESVLLLHPEVTEVAVLGVPDIEWGERVVAVVVPSGAARRGEGPLAAELLDFVRGRLAPGKRPREVRFLDALPRNANGKVDRGALLEPFLPDRGGVTSGP